MTKKSTSPATRNLRNKKSYGLQYQSLEQRLPLDASFSFVAGELTINNFNNDTELTITADGDLIAELDGEEFMGTAGGGVAINGDLDEITVTGATSLVINSGNGDSPSVVTFDVRGLKHLTTSM